MSNLEQSPYMHKLCTSNMLCDFFEMLRPFEIYPQPNNTTYYLPSTKQYHTLSLISIRKKTVEKKGKGEGRGDVIGDRG